MGYAGQIEENEALPEADRKKQELFASKALR